MPAVVSSDSREVDYGDCEISVGLMMLRINVYGVVRRHYLKWVRTLFVSGLPLDIKPRELYLLFRPFKGYEGSLIKLTSKQACSQHENSVVSQHQKSLVVFSLSQYCWPIYVTVVHLEAEM
uniref:Uncharacterized protein n=1 Tax=Sphaerodactylus townsendi TaxID=933632 RepID=A0ACB8ESC1_9SAUR